MPLRPGNRVVVTESHFGVASGSVGVVVVEGWALSGPKVSFGGQPPVAFPERKLERIG
jgi:hypothetical protein